MKNAKRGQVAIYLIMILVVVFFLALLNVDSFIAVRGKNHVQNAGDAAALAAARKQGALLNEIGRLNLDHILAAIGNDTNKCEEIVFEQRRKALLEPVEALRHANEAALKNGMEVRDEFSQILRNHVRDIRLVYSGGENERGEPYPEPFPGAWTQYATAIENVISEGLAVGPDNVEFYDAAGGHTLLNREFYFAVAARNWCWFHFNDMNLLERYNSYHDWGPLPSRRENSLNNSEIFSLHVTTRKGALTDVFSFEEIKSLLETYADVTVTDDELANSFVITNQDQVWFTFDNTRWHPWFDGLRLVGEEDGAEFPLVGEIKPEYNVRGCAAITRCYEEIESFAIEGSSDLTWSAAAKPFGTVTRFDGATDCVTNLRDPNELGAQPRFVLPCFTDVRLVPLDAVGGQNLATADYGWVTHVREHLKPYLQHGPRAAGDCFYCQQLKTWERDLVRQSGIRWLKFNSGSCVRPVSGGSSGGGTSHGH